MTVQPAWAVRERGERTSWFHVLLAFTDGARVDALAVVTGGSVSIEDVRAQPALSLADLTVLADWIETPLFEACGMETKARAGTNARAETESGLETNAATETVAGTGTAYGIHHARPLGPSRARPAWPRGVEGRRLVAEKYRAARDEGLDPVLAVMCATGHSRRRSLRLIAQARDAGLLTPGHARR
ncbi:DUF6214 family protein [Streptomyces sp. HUAS TT20]|uniref:DUF6214 family protein n=1 Tax=Streptomyces sp. HUAS TT20 TaxID=3447509 RepID=UPI0021D9FE63|nr:DUF6214 family protein [Streptomyces sp. HUAS 15-9]UXY32496.1 DUF6214 family protein [Streptomyces sp. HUAS 15-9]